MVKTKQIKTCRKKRHVRIDSMKEMPNLICGKGAVGGNYNSTRDNIDKRKVPGGDGNLEIQQCRKKTKKDMFIVC